MRERSSETPQDFTRILNEQVIQENVQRKQEICEAQLEEFLEALRPRLTKRQVEAVWVFGSRARGTADPESDIDILIVEPTDRPFVERPRDYMPALLATRLRVDMLIYTPEEFQELLDEERPFFVKALEDAVSIDVGRK